MSCETDGVRGRTTGARKGRRGRHLLERGSFQESFHRFAVEWEPGEMRWFVDGEPVHRVRRPARDDPAYWPFDDGHPFFIILNLAVGGWFDQGRPPPDDMQPQRLLVDWVRVYRRARD